MKNAWYVAAMSEELQTGILERMIFSRELLLYRDASGVAQALANQCPHRGARLSDGRVHGDCIACPYHGWEYGGDGRCRYIPANGRDAAIPSGATVQSYPVQEGGGLVWVYMGSAMQPPEFIVPPELSDPGWRSVPFQFEWRAHISRVVESTLDVAHLPFVHKRSTGEVDPTVDGPHFYVEGDVLTIEAKPYHPLVDTPLNEQQSKGMSLIMFRYPNQMMVRTEMFTEKQMATYLTLTPVDEQKIRIYGLALRNFFLDVELVDEIHYEHNVTVLEEDRAVVEKLRPFQSPLELHLEQHVRSDAPQIRYRRMLLKKRQEEPDFEY